MPTTRPEEFRHEVVTVARMSGRSQDQSQVERDSGISSRGPAVREASDIDDDRVKGAAPDEQDELAKIRRCKPGCLQEVVGPTPCAFHPT